MKCTVQWGSELIDDELVVGCQNEAVYEVRQNHRGDKGKILDTTYHIGFNCAKHAPSQNYVLEEIK